jgi:hypothetical protein
MINLTPDLLEKRPDLDLTCNFAVRTWTDNIVDAGIVAFLDLHVEAIPLKELAGLRVPSISFRLFIKNPISSANLVFDTLMYLREVLLV